MRKGKKLQIRPLFQKAKLYIHNTLQETILDTLFSLLLSVRELKGANSASNRAGKIKGRVRFSAEGVLLFLWLLLYFLISQVISNPQHLTLCFQ